MYYREDIERLCSNLKERELDLRDELSMLPDGEFYAYAENGRTRYYQRFRREGNRKKERRVGIKNDPWLVNSLVRKKYVTEALQRLEKDIAAADKLLALYVPADENSVMGAFIDKYPELAGSIYRETKNRHKQGNVTGANAVFHEEGLTSTAADGSYRRSKGEILIGAKLDHYKLEYVYEALAHPDLPYRPDFRIVRPRDGKIFFWEHLGLVNDPEYMAYNQKKLAAYETVGIVPWDNLIITYDQADGGINEKLIDAMIHGWLL